jgi:FlaA1/EpsC-like NDP-sugar epimerase
MVGVVGSWLDLFARTKFADPRWSRDAEAMALAIGTFTCVALCFLWANRDKADLVRIGWRCFWTSFGLLVFCWLMYIVHGYDWHPGYMRVTQTIWEGAFVAAMVSVMVTVVVGSLYVSTESHLATVAIVLALLAVILIAVYFLWWRDGPARQAEDVRSPFAAQVSASFP